jgi:hypothetical protein
MPVIDIRNDQLCACLVSHGIGEGEICGPLDRPVSRTIGAAEPLQRDRSRLRHGYPCERCHCARTWLQQQPARAARSSDYDAASLRRGKWLIPAFHVSLDQEVGVHDDPQNSRLENWAPQLDAVIMTVKVDGVRS